MGVEYSYEMEGEKVGHRKEREEIDTGFMW